MEQVIAKEKRIKATQRILNSSLERDRHADLLDKVGKKFDMMQSELGLHMKEPWNSNEVMETIEARIERAKAGVDEKDLLKEGSM